MQTASGFLRSIETWAEAEWQNEKPTLDAGLKALYADSVPILKTSLGKMALTVVTNLQGVAATDSVAAGKQAADQIVAGAKVEGITVGKNEVNLLITLAVAQLKGLIPAS